MYITLVKLKKKLGNNHFSNSSVLCSFCSQFQRSWWCSNDNDNDNDNDKTLFS